MKIKLAALALVVCSLSPLAHADFINGSFEDPNIGNATLVFVNNNDITGWHTTGLGCMISNGYVGSGVTWHNTPAGNQYLYVASNTADGIVLSQTATLKQGDNELDFLQADFGTQFQLLGGQINVSINRASDNLIVVAPTLFKTPDFSDWIQQTLPFVAPSDDDYIFKFTSVGGHAGLIDDVHVTGQPVPEPATMAVLALGALALKRRRKASN